MAVPRTLYSLLEVAVSRNLLRIPWDNQQEGIRSICNIRNTTMHANYTQAALESQQASVEDYFQNQALTELDTIYYIVTDLISQIDPQTGWPHINN